MFNNSYINEFFTLLKKKEFLKLSLNEFKIFFKFLSL